MIFQFGSNIVQSICFLSKRNGSFLDIGAGYIDLQHADCRFVSQSLYHIHVILYGLTADVHNDLRIIFFQERNISLHEYVNAGVLQTDGIEHTAVYFCHTRGRVAGPGHIGYTLGHHRTQAVQIYEFFIFHAGAKGSGCCHYGVFESYSCNRCLCIHQISTSSASNTGPSVQILALCT